nr:MAG: RNA-dependent RNA polymerase [Leptosphaeria biglobosa negative single-stranded RNA virus 7]
MSSIPLRKPSCIMHLTNLIICIIILMTYYETIKGSPYRNHLSDQLEAHLDAGGLQDLAPEYKLPDIIDNRTKPIRKDTFAATPSNVRIPARLNSPLIPYPNEIKELCNGTYAGDIDYIHGHHRSQIQTLNLVQNSLMEAGKIPKGSQFFDMDSLKRFGRQSYSHRENMINLATLSFAQRATTHDLSITANQTVPFNVGVSNISEYTSFIIMIQRLRIHIAKETNFPSFTCDGQTAGDEEAKYTMFSNGTYVYQSSRPTQSFCLIACGGHFRLFHEKLGYWFCGPISYLDYIFTLADILNNLDILKNCSEYKWASDMFSLMIKFSEHEGVHNLQVDFIKSMEGFFLNMSDYDESFAMNWKPILDAVNELWDLDQRISNVSYDIGLPLGLLRGLSFNYPKESYFCRFIVEGKKLSRTHLQEISALHKLIFYAEVDAEAGVKKFLRRVHTKRVIDTNAVKNITRLAKLQFFTAYRKKHKMMPNTIGPVQKVKLLETYSQKADLSKIETLPLSWWDDVKIFDCMDNTMTDDPLEFAKDKGALKSKISFGPGDSRKELLQVIETENYHLKDFFATKTIKPRRPFVQWTNQKAHPVEVAEPARLIEKEREQKIEARLFANGELSNKHALSLVAARMKKALSYFDEQLMTPTDRKRKSIIHEASRELSQPDNYSLLLDIVGHNQSMQYENTHELSEFIGNLFGFDGWGDLSHYFSFLTVYHYDEYLDKVIESHGQYGGIEGWLNPLWTLHTTLMMKLLRIMTDVVVKTIMVYSDDVNAIISIKQASEPMVQSVFSKIMKHCNKFGMTVKYSQTMLSKHRVTMLRQHYADGIRADSTLKRLISVSAGNNPTIVSDEIEVAGICSSASSAMELSNHHEACAYLKNYKLGLLLCRMPQMILSRINEKSMISPEELPVKLSNLLYYSKDDASDLNLLTNEHLMVAAKNDIAQYLGKRVSNMNHDLFLEAITGLYGQGVAESRLVDSPDRVLYLQVYDSFLQDLLFFWMYMPTSIGGLGASLHLNLMLSGHSVGMTKSLQYLFCWIVRWSADDKYFLRYLTNSLGVDMTEEKNSQENRVVTNPWPSDQRICPATTSVQQSIKSMVRKHTRNKKVIEMFELSDDREKLASELVNIFRNNMHSRIVQFYHENTSIHFIDLLISKIETSSGLLTRVRNITRLRNSLSFRAIENIRMGATTSKTLFFELNTKSDIVQCLLNRKISMFPKISFVEVEEVLYDDKIEEVERSAALLTIRRCSPTHYRNGIKVFDDPKVGNETLYKGELLDNDRMLGNKEELLAAKLVAVTKWFLMKSNLMSASADRIMRQDVVIACNLALQTLTRQTFHDLFAYAPTETGGEILHRIPNMRFSTATYIRSEMNRSLTYTTELNQRLITLLGLVDSNVNFDYLRMRFLISAIVSDKYDNLRRLVIRYGFSRLTGIKDVQFVRPLETDYGVKEKFKCYSDIRGHSLSVMRFRYLSHSYMYEENINEWALMPKLTEAQTAEQIGKNYVNDIIFRYSRDLDKDYMLVSPDLIETGIWKPLTQKLARIDKNWKLDSGRSDEEEISVRLQSVLEERSKITIVDKSNPVILSLQSQCLDIINELGPSDIEFQSLVQKYSEIAQHRRHSARLAIRLSQYQMLLANYERHRLDLARSLLHEYITTFHFKVKTIGQEMVPDVEEMFREFLQSGVGKFSLMAISPDLQVRLMILGFEYVERVVETQMSDLLSTYRDLLQDVSCGDIVMPIGLPSVPTWTALTGLEKIPEELHEIEYIAEDLPSSALATIDQAGALFKYAHMCSTGGADPHVFTSHTGSDSLGAQIGFFRLLKGLEVVTDDDKVCDLTAGRGDGQYALRANGLHGVSFSLEDTFTRLNHHPDVVFKTDYDVFNGATLKFITDFDFIHVDISFTGTSDKNILDLILILEENNLPYSIRLNSVNLHGYDEIHTNHLPNYTHRIAYAVSSRMKPYQVYLIGQPSTRKRNWNGPEMKSTLAFKAMALSFSQLLDPVTQTLRLEGFKPNSASINLPDLSKTSDFIQKVCAGSVASEQLHYLSRYVSEIGPDAMLEFSFNHLAPAGKNLIQNIAHQFHVTAATSYSGLTIGQIGNVSTKSRTYHESHVNAMIKGTTPIWTKDITACDEQVLNYFRTHHPIQEIRTWCNIVIGLHTFCRKALLSGPDALIELHGELNNEKNPRLSLHQREISLSIKLLILAARDDDFTYGVRYCRKLMATGSRSKVSVSRTLRSYRLLSYLYIEIQEMMKHGGICIRSLDSIANELEVREKKRFRYVRQKEAPEPFEDQDGTIKALIEQSFDHLFDSLANYAENLAEEHLTTDHPVNFSNETMTAELHFDIGLEEHIEAMIQRLNLQPSGPRGIIDLGDDDIIEFDDY